ncbi:MAG: DNA translocase FtsK [Bacteroidales bacterium]|nr:DNA translocase FtsK [Bacteroidales bacterium]
MDKGKKTGIITVAGLIAGAFALFTFLAVVSFFFTWKADQSLLSDPGMMSISSHVHNICGKLGYRWAYFLVTKCIGVGSLALVFIIGAISVRLLARKKVFSLVRSIMVVLTGSILVSFLFSFLSKLFGSDNFFGGGLGGECGSYVILWSENLFGVIVTFLILAVLIAIWLFSVSKKFTSWLSPADQPEKAVSGESGESNDSGAFAGKSGAVPVEEKVVKGVETSDNKIEKEQSTKPEEKPAEKEETKETGDQGIEIIKDGELDTKVKKELERINTRDELPDYKFPSLDLLDDYASSRQDVPSEELIQNNNKIRATLLNYKIQVLDVKAVVGPTVTLYKVYPAPGVKISAIKNLQEDIAMSLHAKGVRVVNLPDAVGIEVANNIPSIVPLKALLNDDAYRSSKAELPVALGYTITQKVKVFDLAEAPHLLIAGATKQGKSVGLNVIVSSLLYAKHPSELKFVFIDPKMVEFTAYSRLIKHYLAVLPDSVSEEDEINSAIIKKPKLADLVLRSLCTEMDSRYELLSKAGVNNIKLYNDKYKNRVLLPTEGHHFLPYMVVVIDEYADLTMSVGTGPETRVIAKNITMSIIRLAQKGRAAGIHVIIATQRPSVDVITGLIKTNFPTRIAFRVVTRVDSSTILDSPGAEKLIGKGDMLYYAGVETERVQCAFISGKEINAVTSFIGNQKGYGKSYNTPYYLPEPEPDKNGENGGMVDMRNLDERFEEAARLVVTSQKGSTSDLQRRLGMGYAKAGRVMDQLEAAGIVGPQEGSRPRQVLVPDFDSLEKILNAYMGGDKNDE